MEDEDPDGVGLNDPMYSKATPVDNMMIAHILASYLRCVPRSKPLCIPDFRLLQLCDKAAIAQAFTGDANAVESIGAILCIALHFAVTPDCSPDSVFKCTALLETVVAECLVVFHLKENNLQLLHPTSFLETDSMPAIYNVFADCFEQCKDVLRDIIRLIRGIRTKSKQDDRFANESSDCYKPHTMFLFSGLALAHLCCMLKSRNNVNVVPGLMESIVLLTFVRPTLNSPEEVKREAEEREHKAKNSLLRLRKEEASNLIKYMQIINALCLSTIHHAFDEKNLLEIKLVRARANKKLAHPDVVFMQVQAQQIRQFLESVEHDNQFEKRHGRILGERNLPLKGLVDGGGIIPPNLLKKPIEDFDASESTFSMFSDAPRAKKKSAFDDPETDYFWHTMNRSVHEAALATRPLRRPLAKAAFYPADYEPVSINYKAKGKELFRPLKDDYLVNLNIDLYECIHFHCDDHYLARLLNPTQLLYWVALHFLDFLHLKTRDGEGFHRTAAGLARDLRLKVTTLAHSRLSGTVETRASHAASSSSAAQVGAAREKAAKKEASAVLSLMDRLSIAQEEAKFESELNALESELAEAGALHAKRSKLKAVDRRLGSGLKALRRVADAEQARLTLEPLIAKPVKHAQERAGLLARALLPSSWAEEEAERWYPSSDSEEEEDEAPIGRKQAAVIEEHHNPVSQLLENPLTKDVSRFRNKLRDEGVVLRVSKRESKALAAKGVSSLWLSFYAADDPGKSAFKKKRSANAKEAEREHVLQLRAEATQKKAAEDLLARELQDEKELQIGRVRAIRLAVLNEKRDAKKEAMVQSSIMRARFQEDEKNRSMKERAERRKEALVLRDLQEAERVRILEIRHAKKHARKDDDIERREREELEKVRLQGMSNRKEFDEIVRRNMEEERMRSLEGRRKLVEDRDLLVAERRRKEWEKRRREFRALRDQFVGKVRMGSFWYHSGSYGFYDNVRAAPVSWMQYEYEDGTPYYWDPLTNKTQLERPTDAPIRHFRDDEREAHDAVHGKGSYDDMVADKAYKDAVNANGGWWDADGSWVLAHGYYDANYEWVPYEGYHDENGAYIRYAKVSGDLSFMV